MSLFKVLDVASSGMSSQSTRLNATASNLANAENTAGAPDQVYKARHPVFAAVLDSTDPQAVAAGVRVEAIVEDNSAPHQLFAPENPLADENGYIYMTNVNAVEEMANMISASRSYQMNAEVMNTTKQLLLRTLQIGE
jgi:flagellar basal-body rod protein FlgC